MQYTHYQVDRPQNAGGDIPIEPQSIVTRDK